MKGEGSLCFCLAFWLGTRVLGLPLGRAIIKTSLPQEVQGYPAISSPGWGPPDWGQNQEERDCGRSLPFLSHQRINCSSFLALPGTFFCSVLLCEMGQCFGISRGDLIIGGKTYEKPMCCAILFFNRFCLFRQIWEVQNKRVFESWLISLCSKQIFLLKNWSSPSLSQTMAKVLFGIWLWFGAVLEDERPLFLGDLVWASHPMVVDEWGCIHLEFSVMFQDLGCLGIGFQEDLNPATILETTSVCDDCGTWGLEILYKWLMFGPVLLLVSPLVGESWFAFIRAWYAVIHRFPALFWRVYTDLAFSWPFLIYLVITSLFSNWKKLTSVS